MKFFRNLFSRLFNRYEGGQRYGTSRSWLPAHVQDARFDANQATREELVRKTRYFERNNAIVNRLVDLFEQFTVGPGGLQFVPKSDSEKWNTARKAKWDQWCKVCDLTSLHGFGTLQSLVARCWFIDGEIFIYKTSGTKRVSGEPSKRPRIQLIEAHRVATPSAEHLREGKTIIDGIELDPATKRPIGYWVRTSDAILGGIEKYELLYADDIIHVFEPSRPGQYRGLPMLYPVLNDLHDLDDLQILEIDAAKDAAQYGIVITNSTGEPNREAMTVNRFSTKSQDASGNETTENRTSYLKKVLRAKSLFLKRGEDAKFIKSDRPSVAVQAFWDYMAWKVCAGVGISKLLVFPVSIQGTVARGDYDIACAFFSSRSAVLAGAFGRIYEWVTEWDVNNDRELSDKPGNWKSYTVQAPRKINVDVGRNSSAMLAELDAGATTYAEIYGPLGKDWREQIRQRFIEESYIDQLSQEFKGMAPDRIRKSIGDQLERVAAEEALRAKEDEESGKPPVYES